MVQDCDRGPQQCQPLVTVMEEKYYPLTSDKLNLISLTSLELKSSKF